MSLTPIQLKTQEEYAHLKEINSLMLSLAKTNQHLFSNNDRLDFINKKRADRVSEIEQCHLEPTRCKKQLNDFDQEVLKLNQRIDKIKSDLNLISTLAQQTKLESEMTNTVKHKDQYRDWETNVG